MGIFVTFFKKHRPVLLGLGLLAGCTTSFPLSLIDGGQEDAQRNPNARI